MIGGILGNLIDRIRFGEVIDFIQMGVGKFKYPWLYNLADAYVSIGMAILIYLYVFKAEARVCEEPPPE